MTEQLSVKELKNLALKEAEESNPSEWSVLDTEVIDIYFWEPSQFFVAEVQVIFLHRECFLYRIAIDLEGKIVAKACDSISVPDELINWLEKRDSLLQPDDDGIVYIPNEYIPDGYYIDE
jgi:hypothetical protein